MGITQYTGAAVGSWMQNRNELAAAVHSGNCSENRRSFCGNRMAFFCVEGDCNEKNDT